MENYLLAKFGQKKHLESLKEGWLYLNPIQKYRDDGTDFRGDKNEGVVPIDPYRISIKNSDGKDFFSDLGLPRPSIVLESIQNDENTFIFCAAMITDNILKLKDECRDIYVLTEDFKKAIHEFGDYVLIFQSDEILKRLSTANANYTPKFGYISQPIIYRNLNDFSEKSNYFTLYNRNNSEYDRYFVKDIDGYENQNEWRLLIDGCEKPLEANLGEGFSIFIGKLDFAYLCDIQTLFDKIEYGKDSISDEISIIFMLNEGK